MVDIEITGKGNNCTAFINFLRQAQRDMENFEVEENVEFIRHGNGIITQYVRIAFDYETLVERKFRISLTDYE